MKTDREFLNGIYQKAEELEHHKESETAKISIFQRKATPIIAAAVFLMIVLPTAWFGRSFPMKEQLLSMERAITPFAIAAEPIELTTQELIEQSDYIIRGKVKKIEKSVYENENNIVTDVIIKISDSYKNKLFSKQIRLRVNGGYDKKTDVYIPYDAFFEKSEDVLLFLDKTDEGYYTLLAGNQSKLTYQETIEGNRVYCDTNGKTISVSELTN